MDFATFKRILTTFVDTSTNIDISKGKLICEIRDGLIEAEVNLYEGEIFVTENDERLRANSWLVRRVARLPLLADRILVAFPEPEHFIAPEGVLLDQLDENASQEDEPYGDAIKLTADILNRRAAGFSSVVYLTSDAGEGKTTLITHLARIQAQKFQRKESDWLLIPIPLGGKPFFRFDDLVVGYLGNRLRFPLFYYDAFMELVKMGVLVPAFDGFEEMFIQNASGDALSAIGQLVQKMESSGNVLIAARKAYFEYQDIRSQARLFDSIGTNAVAFSRVSLKRWNKSQFLAYCDSRCIPEGENIYQSVAKLLGPDHPLLTRAVLVKRLLDVANETKNLTDLLLQIGKSRNDYFALFVRAIIEREAQEKWINRVGEPHLPLLKVQDHFELLAGIAQEMWTLSTDSLKAEVLDFLTELFCEAKSLSPDVTHQIKERTKQHALIVGADSANRTFAFDHEEFRHFFLGDAIGRICVSPNQQQKMELLALLRRGSLPGQSIDAAVSVIRQSPDVIRVMTLLQDVTCLDGPTSFTQENVAKLLIRILNGADYGQTTLARLTFTANALQSLKLSNVTFDNCAFGVTSLEHTILHKCRFNKCRFDQIEISPTAEIVNTQLNDCNIASVIAAAKGETVYDPIVFPQLLRLAGFQFPANIAVKQPATAPVTDPNIKNLGRLIRCFQLRTHLNENVVLRKLGPGAEIFIREIIPQLIKAGVLGEEWNPRDRQHRYHLAMSMERVHDVLQKSGNSIADFLTAVTSG